MSMYVPHSFPANDASSRLRQLSDEVSKIATSLAQLSSSPQETPHVTGELNDCAPTVSLDAVTRVLKARRLRDRFFDTGLFADPAWDILLELFRAELGRYRVSVSSLCIAADVPATTALRWISAMTDSGMLRRAPDPRDGRRIFVELTPKASAAMQLYFASPGASTTI